MCCEERRKGLYGGQGDMLVKMKSTDDVILSATEASDKMFYVKSPTEQANIAQSKQPYDFWHSALEHPSKTSIKPEAYADGNILPTQTSKFFCEPCILAKSTHNKPNSTNLRTCKPFELVYSDLVGPFPIESIGLSKYSITFVDGFTQHAWVLPPK
jgi:hypothetical protein